MGAIKQFIQQHMCLHRPSPSPEIRSVGKAGDFGKSIIYFVGVDHQSEMGK